MIIMDNWATFRTKIAEYPAKTKNPITIGAGIVTTVLLLLSSPLVGVMSVWAANFVGTSGPDTLVGTD